MCYSAEASFVSGVVLMGAGACCLHRARSRAPWFWPYAIVPCLFAVQQFAEGVVWIGLHHENKTLIENGSAVYLFLHWPFGLSGSHSQHGRQRPFRQPDDFLDFGLLPARYGFLFFPPGTGKP